MPAPTCPTKPELKQVIGDLQLSKELGFLRICGAVPELRIYSNQQLAV